MIWSVSGTNVDDVRMFSLAFTKLLESQYQRRKLGDVMNIVFVSYASQAAFGRTHLLNQNSRQCGVVQILMYLPIIARIGPANFTTVFASARR